MSVEFWGFFLDPSAFYVFEASEKMNCFPFCKFCHVRFVPLLQVFKGFWTLIQSSNYLLVPVYLMPHTTLITMKLVLSSTLFERNSQKF